jgi:Circularly permutated YpsA SLOG family
LPSCTAPSRCPPPSTRPGPGPNARDSDATIWLGDPGTPGGRTTLRACAALGRLVYLAIDGLTRPSDVAAWIEAEEVRVLNVAGNRESSTQRIGEGVERFLVAVLQLSHCSA